MRSNWMMKSRVWSAVAALVLAAAVAIPVMAQPQPGDGPRTGARGFGGRGAPFGLLRGLELSDAQREQIRSITQERRAEGNRPQQRIGELNKQLHLALLAESPDGQKIEELKTAIAAATSEELTARIDVQTRIAQVLTAEQRVKAREALAKAGPLRGPGGRGPRPGAGQ